MQTRSKFTSSQIPILSMSDNNYFLRHKRYIEYENELENRLMVNKRKKICLKNENNLNPLLITDSYINHLMEYNSGNFQLIGFKNLGNTCFINSVLQCFLHCTPLKNYFIINEHKHLNNNNNNKNFCFLCEFSKLIDLTKNTKEKYISPVKMINNMKLIFPDFNKGKQEDAHELLLFLLSYFEQSCIKFGISLLTNYYNNIVLENNLISKIFSGKIISKVQCGRCKTFSNTSDTFLNISLSILNSFSLIESIEHYCQNEKLIGENQYFCDKCKIKCDSKRQIIFSHLPKILIFHLKRFDNNRRKIKKHIEFKIDYNFNKFCTNKVINTNYSLAAALIHEGYSTNSGHYLTYVKNPNNNWYCFDDINVRLVNENEVLQSHPYILFYQQNLNKYCF